MSIGTTRMEKELEMARDKDKNNPNKIIEGPDQPRIGIINGSKVFQYAVFLHYDVLVSNESVGDSPQLGCYFSTAAIHNALNAWGSAGWVIPNIAVSWEKIASGVSAGKYAFRIRNGGAPVVTGDGTSAVIAMREVIKTNKRK